MLNAFAIACLYVVATGAPADQPCVLVVVGASGSSEYDTQFRLWADQWVAAAKKGSADVVRIGQGEQGGATDRERLRATLAEKAGSGLEPLWIVLIGHGTYDGREAKFNLRGPDVSELELSEWLGATKRPVALIDCTSASSPFLNRLSADNRVLITATRSGNEQNFARFGQYLAEAIADPRADIDKDGQVSLLEAYLTASSRVAEYYRSHSQLATEHALLDDNGDRLGTPPDWFHGVRATRRAKDNAPLDGLRAHQLHLIPSARERLIPVETRQRRDKLELAIATLRDKKPELTEDDYYSQLESLMLELARLYQAVPSADASPSVGK
jgi:hypothetical protein